MAPVYAAASAAVATILSGVELEAINSPYVCEQQPLIVRAISNAKDVIRAFQSSIASTTLQQDAERNFDAAASVAVGAVGQLAQTVGVSTSLTLHALHSIAAIVTISSRAAPSTPSTYSSTHASASLQVVAEGAPRTGMDTTATEAAPHTGVLQSAVHIALHTRFTPVSKYDEGTVGTAVVDVLASVLRHSDRASLAAPVLQALFAALARICVDGIQPPCTRSRACSVMVECAPAVAKEAARQGGATMTGLQASLLELMNMLCDVLGTDAADVPVVPQGILPHTRVLLPPCALVHTYMPLPIEAEPLEHMRYAPTHAIIDSGSSDESSRVQVDWAAYEKRLAASEAHAQTRGVVPTVELSNGLTQGGADGQTPEQTEAHGRNLGQRKPSFSSASSPVTITLGNEARLIDAVPRVLAVHDSAPLLALRVLTAMLSQLEGTDTSSAFRRSTAILVKQRITLALCWMSDGCGPDDTALSHVHVSAWGHGNKGGAGLFSGLFGSTSKAEWEEGPRRSFRSLAGAAPGAGGGGSLLIPRLPCLRSALEMLLVIVRDPVTSKACKHEVVQLLLRVILRGLTAPARLVYAAAAQVTPLSALRVVMDQLCELQKFRGRNSSSSAAGSSTPVGTDGRPVTGIDSNGPADVLPLTGAELNAATKSVVGALGVASKRSVREGGPELSAAIDPESIRALVQLLHPRSAMMLTSVACLEALQELLRANASLPCMMFHHGDAQLGGHDALRVTCQMLAAMALGEAHVHTLHGVLSIWGDAGAAGSSAAKGSQAGPLPLPLPESIRHTAYDTLLLLLAEFQQKVQQPSLTDMSPPDIQSHLDESTVSLRANLRYKRLLQSCAKTFNGKPSRGIEALRATGLLELVMAQMTQNAGNASAAMHSPGPVTSSSAAASTPATHLHHAAVAHLLKWYGGAAGFDPVAVGQYLGAGEGAEEDSKRRAHAAAFVQECAGKPLLTALRTYLSSFRLPGEAQQIDRILQAFAGLAHTVCSESGLLPSIDATYLLTFSIIMLNTDLHNPAIRADRRMTEDGFVRNNTYYGDEMCHGRKIPEATLRAIYKEIRDNPIAPPPASFALLPVLAPATDVGSSAGAASNNTAVAQTFVSSGDAISATDWQAVCEGPLQSSAKTETTDVPEAVVLSASWRAAVPEVWHAAVRVGLAGFTAAFRTSQGGSMLPPSGRQGMPVVGTDAIKYQARSHLRTLAACAGLAAMCNMTSGMDIIISALSRIATHSLKCPYEVALHGSDVDTRGGDGSVRGALGALAHALFGTGSGPGGSSAGEKDRSRYGGTGRPSSGSEASLALDGTTGYSVPVQAVVTPVRASAAGLNRAAHAHGQRGNLGRQPSFLAMSPPPLLEDDAGQDERGEHSQYFTAVSHAAARIADDFLSDLRAQMALSAAIAISMPEAQGGHGAKLGEHGWKWLAVCMLRLHRCGLWSLPASVHDPFSGGSRSAGRRGSPVDGQVDTSQASPAGDVGPVEETLLQPLTLSSLSSLCHAYCLASAQARYAQRVHRAALAQGLSRSTFANAFRAHNTVQQGKAMAQTNAQAASGGTQPAQDQLGVIGGVLGWFFGSSDASVAAPASVLAAPTATPQEVTAADNADSDDDAAFVSSSSEIVDVNALLTGSEAEYAELSAVLAEEPDADSTSDMLMDETAGRESPDPSEHAVAHTTVSARPVGLAIRRPPGAHTASIEALAANINLLLSSAGSLPSEKLMALARVFAWASCLPEPSASSLNTARGSSSVSGTGAAAADDDGSAFISGMETCRFKCALLSPPAELPPTTSAARAGILVHAFVLSLSLPGPTASLSPSARTTQWTAAREAYVVTLREILSTAEAATSRVRTAATGLLLLASRHLSAAVQASALASVTGTKPDPAVLDIQWIRDALYELCDAQPPCGGMLRILIVSWLYSLYVHSPPSFAALATVAGARGGHSEGVGLSHVLVLASQQGWSDDVEAELPMNDLDASMDTEGTDELSWLVGGGSDHRHVLSVAALTLGRLVVRLSAALLRQQVQNTPADGEPSLDVLPALARYANHRGQESFSALPGTLNTRLALAALPTTEASRAQRDDSQDSIMEGSVELSLDAMDGMAAAVNLALATLQSNPERWRAVSQMIVVLSNPCSDPRPAVRLHALALLQDVLCRAVQGLQQSFEIGRDLTSVVQTLLDLAVTTAEKVQEISLFPTSAEAHGLTPLVPAQPLVLQGQGIQSEAVCERTVLAAAELGSKVWLAVITSPPEVLQFARLNAYQEAHHSGAPSPRSLQAEAEAWLQQGWNRVARLLEPDTALVQQVSTVDAADASGHGQQLVSTVGTDGVLALPRPAAEQGTAAVDGAPATAADGAAAMPEKQQQVQAAPVLQAPTPVVHVRLSTGLSEELTLLARKVVTVTEGHTQAASPVPA